jgi:hypothetical protein
MTTVLDFATYATARRSSDGESAESAAVDSAARAALEIVEAVRQAGREYALRTGESIESSEQLVLAVVAARLRGAEPPHSA